MTNRRSAYLVIAAATCAAAFGYLYLFSYQVERENEKIVLREVQTRGAIAEIPATPSGFKQQATDSRGKAHSASDEIVVSPASSYEIARLKPWIEEVFAREVPSKNIIVINIDEVALRQMIGRSAGSGRSIVQLDLAQLGMHSFEISGVFRDENGVIFGWEGRNTADSSLDLRLLPSGIRPGLTGYIRIQSNDNSRQRLHVAPTPENSHLLYELDMDSAQAE
ncbi:hypothetical protein [Lentisalinibacter orientalis]|uniref:hypothetical protein n=1 Tax=Lentisalinibacter orientalis TaxID=2992241 RepID=UPI003867B1AC